ncbi:MAG TPA: hypothetical protein VOA41_21855 [Candidatus Dormibacteraeota bacterium]|nr:hypothetical protein [Candidatus Dormibacteraeota bacterium]
MSRLRTGLWLAILLFTSASLAAQGSCPVGLAPETTCLAGRDIKGAYFLIAIPTNYNGQLVLWNHGYSLNPPAKLSAADLGPSLGFLQFGFAAAASSYRPNAIGLGGWAVKDGAEDTDNLRRRFIELFGRPDRTFVVGASEGGLITAAIAELFGRDEDGNLNYDGALPLCGPLAGGRKNWYGGFDLRVIYQYYCRNLPRPSESQYPLYFGLAPDNTLTSNQLAARIDECTGVLHPPALRTPQQASNLANILNVTKTPESFLLTDMGFATFGLQELTLVRSHGLSPVTNLGAEYEGSVDDDALNRGVFRAGADRDADAFLASAYDPNGRFRMPVVTLHTIGDGLVIVENENAYRQTAKDAHNLRRLQQNYVNANGHCEFTNSEVLGAFQALLSWVETHRRPTREDVLNLCQTNTLLFHDKCNLNLSFKPQEINTRIVDRDSNDDERER